MFIVENASVTRASGAEVASYLNELVRKCFENDDYCVARPATEGLWTADSTDGSLALLPSATPKNFDILDFTAVTEDVTASALTSSAWDFPTLDDLNELAQWNTAPTLPGSHAGLDCTGTLGNWNFTAPVAWNLNNTSELPAASVEKKRKRTIDDVSDDIERRVSPKTTISSMTGNSSLSPETSTRRSSSVVDPPVVDGIAKKSVMADKKFACPYYKNNPLKFRHKRTCCGPGWPTVHRVK